MRINLSKLRRSLVYQNVITPSSLSKELKNLAEIDDLFAKKELYERKVSTVGCLVVIISFIFTLLVAPSLAVLIDSSFVPGFLTFIMLTLCVWGTGVAIVYYFKANSRKRLNFSKVRYRYKLLNHLNKLLQNDINTDDKIKVILDLKPIENNKKLIQQKKHPLYRKGVIRLHRDNWLTVQGEFIDRTKFILQITEYCQFSNLETHRGRIKYKTKPKGFVISLILKPLPSSKYDKLLANRKLDIVQFIKLPEKVNLHKIYFRKYKLGIVAKIPFLNTNSLNNQVELLRNTITMMFLSGFQIINLPVISEHKKAS